MGVKRRGATAPVDEATAAVDERLHAIFVAEYQGLCRVAYLLVGGKERAEDIVMDAFGQVLAAMRRNPGLQPSRAYLRKTIVHLGYRSTRRVVRQRLGAERVRTLFVDAAEPDSHLEEMQVVRAVLAGLPPHQRAVVVLRLYLDLPDAAVAETLGCSVGTVKSQFAKARRRLARAVDENTRASREDSDD